MVIVGVHRTPSLTRERYEEVVRRLTGKNRIDDPSDLPFSGLLVHFAGEIGRDALGTIPREVGIERGPEFFPAHTYYSERARLP